MYLIVIASHLLRFLKRILGTCIVKSLNSLLTCINLDHNSKAAILSSFSYRAVSGKYPSRISLSLVLGLLT